MDRAKLKEIIFQAFRQASCAPQADLSEATELQGAVGLDSLGMVSVAVEVEDRLNITMELDEVRHLQTVGDLLKVLEAKLAATAVKSAA